MAIEFPPMRKILSLIAYFALAMLIATLLVEHHPPHLEVGTKAPMDEKIRLLAGGTTDFRRLSSKKPLLINFFATWCPPCLKELELLSLAHKKYRSRATFIGIGIQSDPADIMSIKQRFDINYQLGQLSEESIDKWQGFALPLTYLVDPNGTILWAHAGVVSEDELLSALDGAAQK